MGINRNEGYTSGVVIRGKPIEHEKSILRQGQSIRLLHAMKCSCISEGQPSIYCTLCYGKGYRLLLQDEVEVLEENSKHYGENILYPDNIPISRIRKVQRWVHPRQGGNEFYNVESYNDNSIVLVDNGKIPKRFEPIKVTYFYKNCNSIVNENSEHSGSYLLKTIGTELDTKKDTSNPFYIFGDILRVNRVYNKTQDKNYTIAKFFKRFIYIDNLVGTVAAPLATDILEVDYDYVPPMRAVLSNVETGNAVLKYFEDVKVNDIIVTLPGSFHIGRGDVITALSTILKNQVIIKRGGHNYDELPSFDVFEIDGIIEDEDGKKYDNTAFELQEYNNLVWIDPLNQPAANKRYSINYFYRPSYMVYRQQTKTINVGDRRYPFRTFARFFNRFSWRDLDIINKD